MRVKTLHLIGFRPTKLVAVEREKNMAVAAHVHGMVKLKSAQLLSFIVIDIDASFLASVQTDFTLSFFEWFFDDPFGILLAMPELLL